MKTYCMRTRNLFQSLILVFDLILGCMPHFNSYAQWGYHVSMFIYFFYYRSVWLVSVNIWLETHKQINYHDICDDYKHLGIFLVNLYDFFLFILSCMLCCCNEKYEKIIFLLFDWIYLRVRVSVCFGVLPSLFHHQAFLLGVNNFYWQI